MSSKRAIANLGPLAHDGLEVITLEQRLGHGQPMPRLPGGWAAFEDDSASPSRRQRVSCPSPSSTTISAPSRRRRTRVTWCAMDSGSPNRSPVTVPGSTKNRWVVMRRASIAA